MTRTETVTRNASEDKKLELCKKYFLERKRINAETAQLKKELYPAVEAVLASGELVTFEIDGELKGVKKSPTTTKETSHALLREQKLLTEWKVKKAKADRLAAEYKKAQADVSDTERKAQVRVETGFSIKTLDNPKVS